MNNIIHLKKQIIDMGHFTPMFFILYSFFQGIFFRNPYLIILSILSWIDFSYIGPRMKKIARKNGYDTPRPFCKTTTEAPHCNGMPSGHTETMAFFFSFIFIHTIISKRNENYFLIFISFIGFIFMGFQRVISFMHTQEQVFWGGLIGLFLGPVFFCPFYILDKYLN